MANRKVALLWYCKTPKGWRRFPVLFGRNARLRPGYVLWEGKETHFEEGRYELRLYEGRKPVYKRAGDNAADALAAQDREIHLLTAQQAAGVAGVRVTKSPSRTNLRGAADAFRDEAVRRGALESAQVNRAVTDEFLSVTGLTFADEITRDAVLEFHRALRARNCGPRTVSNKHKRLRSFLIYCRLDHKAIMPPTPIYAITIPDTYSPADLGRILRVAEGPTRLSIQLGLMCGLRDQEMMHLEWTDIQWAESTLCITGKPDWGFKIKEAEEREIPIPATLLACLDERHKANPDSKLVLPTRAGKPDSKLLRQLKRLAKAHGLNCGMCAGCASALGECQSWTLRKLRRSYCTALLRSGMDLRAVQKFMGHADLASTMRYITPTTSKVSQARIDAIEWC